MTIKFSVLFVSVLSLFFFSDCKKDTTVFDNQLKADIVIINNYLTSKGLTADSTASGLRYIVQAQGGGNYPTSNSLVKVRYKGYLTNGTVFDESASGITFGLNEVIPGWTEGMQKFREGGKGILLLPSHLGYGPNGAGSSIPPNTVIIFDVDLIQVF